MPLNEKTLTELASEMSSGKVSAVEIAQSCLDAITKKNPLLNAVESVDTDTILAQATKADADRAAGMPLGLLHGLPIAFKANIDLTGYPTTGSSPALKEYRPAADAPTVAALKAQGAIPMGKLNMHELAFGATSNNSWCGSVRNPFGTDRVPGGSSGGSGSAVGGNLVPAALGTDTGGSVRVPAALCGAAGFRPTTGRWSTDGILPISHTRDTAGPIAHSVADLDLLDRAVTDPTRKAAKASPLNARRFGVPRGFFFDNLTEDVANATERACLILEAAGAEFVDIELPDLWREIDRDGMLIAVWEFKENVTAYLSGSDVFYDALLDQIASPDVAAVAESIRGLPAETLYAYKTILSEKRPAWQKRMADLFAENRLDALVFPMVCTTAPEIGKDATIEIGGIELPVFDTLVRNSAVGSVLGMPGLALPNGIGSDGLPISLGLDGPIGSDANLLSLGMSVERALTEA